MDDYLDQLVDVVMDRIEVKPAIAKGVNGHVHSNGVELVRNTSELTNGI